MVAQGLRWTWGDQGPPPLRSHRPYRGTSLSIQSRIEELLSEEVIELAPSRVFLNRLFEVPKRDSLKTRLVLDVSRLNRSIPTFPFKMTTVSTV
ncbi:MAG: hypothetical protein AAGJ80_12730, partial [Cyanobacteria bacterium J06553_1]